MLYHVISCDIAQNDGPIVGGKTMAVGWRKPGCGMDRNIGSTVKLGEWSENVGSAFSPFMGELIIFHSCV